MISYIIGTVTKIFPTEIYLENNGMGYRIYMPLRDLEHLPQGKENQKIYTYLSVREDAMELFGFLSEEEKQIFKLLITVNGVGPKAALNILGLYSAKDLQFAIAGDDAKMISKAPGVGAKTAQKIILELKDKIALEDLVSSSLDEGERTQNTTSSENPDKNDAILALSALGYSTSEILRALSDVEDDPNRDVQGWMKEALKHLSN